MQIKRHNPVGAGTRDEIGDKLGRDRRARPDFAVLPCIAEIGDHGGDAAGRGAAQRIYNDE